MAYLELESKRDYTLCEQEYKNCESTFTLCSNPSSVPTHTLTHVCTHTIHPHLLSPELILQDIIMSHPSLTWHQGTRDQPTCTEWSTQVAQRA